MQVVVIGNGIAGNTAATTIVESGRDVNVTILSEDINPLYSPCVFAKYLGGELKRENLFLQDHSYFYQSGIEKIFGRKVTKIDPHCKKVYIKSEGIAYDKLILATGSKPMIPPIPGLEHDGVFTLKTLHDVDSIEAYLRKARPQTIAIVGSGPIGLEVAINLRKRGFDVCIAEMCDCVAPKLLDKKPASILQHVLEQNQIQVYLGEDIKCISGNGSVRAIATDSKEIACDFVCLAVGMRARNQLAQEAGIDIGPRGGVKVDDRMQTSIKEIYACGDCVETEDIPTGINNLSLLWHTAKLQGYTAACNCLGENKPYPGSLNYAVVDVFGEYLISSGHTLNDFTEVATRIIEIDPSNSYLRILTSEDTIVGLQFIGRNVYQELGALLNLIRRRAKVTELRNQFGAWAIASYLPPWFESISTSLSIETINPSLEGSIVGNIN